MATASATIAQRQPVKEAVEVMWMQTAMGFATIAQRQAVREAVVIMWMQTAMESATIAQRAVKEAVEVM